MVTKINENTIKINGKIDSNNAAEFEKNLLSAAGANYTDITLDAAGLEYISSAGLRVLLKLKKGTKGKVSVINVSYEIYDIFNVTGFDNILDVKKALRELSVDKMEVIGRGLTGSVYRADKETVIKVFNKNVNFDMITDERAKAQNAFVFGVPTAISYDMVRVGESYGLVYELLDAKDLLDVIVNDKANLEEYIKKFALKMREMHSIEADDGFVDIKTVTVNYLGFLEGKVCTADEVEKMRAVIKNIPERNTFIHGDAHIGNVMLQDGEFMFIDLSGAGKGHPIFDMVSMCLVFNLGQTVDEETRKNSELMRWFDMDEMKLMWDTYIGTYLGNDDKVIIEKANEQITAVACVRALMATAAIPGHFSEELIAFFKNTAIAHYDKGLEPICF
ncbi:MAG: anti-sigma factor antagonist [Firmicutes bacterium]|nr:anti-sigma factor antagonist [Bacillota bacterium]